MAVSIRGSTPEVEAWVQTTMWLIGEASAYAEAGQYDAEVDGMIRRIRVVTSALQAALQNIGFMPPPIVTPTLVMADPPAKTPPAPTLTSKP